jgi:hypothetical protein
MSRLPRSKLGRHRTPWLHPQSSRISWRVSLLQNFACAIHKTNAGMPRKNTFRSGSGRHSISISLQFPFAHGAFAPPSAMGIGSSPGFSGKTESKPSYYEDGLSLLIDVRQSFSNGSRPVSCRIPSQNGLQGFSFATSNPLPFCASSFDIPLLDGSGNAPD